MSYAYSVTTGVANVTLSLPLYQLPTGEPVFAYLNPSTITLAYAASHTTPTTIAASISAPSGTAYQSSCNPVVVVDNSGNLYVIAGASTGTQGGTTYYGATVTKFTKGSGYSWTQTAQGVAGTSQLTGVQAVAGFWVNSGGTGGAGYVLALACDSTHIYFATFDAGNIAGGGVSSYVYYYQYGVSGSFSPATTGVGGIHGIVGIYANQGNGQFVTWSVSNSGAVSVTAYSPSFGGPNSIVGFVGLPNGSWAGFDGTYMRVCDQQGGVSSISAAIPSSSYYYFLSGEPIGSQSAFYAYCVANDPLVSNQVWIYGTDGSGNIVRISCACGSGTPTWGSWVVDSTGWPSFNGKYTAVVQYPTVDQIDYQVLPSNTTTIYGGVTVFASPPAAPTLVSPANASYQDVSSGQTFTATYNSTDKAPQNAYAFRIKTSSGRYNYYNASTNALQSTIVWNSDSVSPGANFSTTLSSSLIANGNTYNWSFASQEATANLQGPFASDFTLNAQTGPTLSVTAPIGSVPSSTPNVSWTATPAPGASITNYRVVVYNSNQYSASGFTPGSGPSVYDTGVQSGNPGTIPIPSSNALSNQTSYRAYVQVTETGGQNSLWQYSSFTTNFDVPAVPTIVALQTTDPTTGCPMIQLTCQGHDNLLTYNQASLENGNTTGWQGVLNLPANLAVATTPTPPDGQYSLQLTPQAAGEIIAQTPPGINGIPIVPGIPITAMAMVRAAQTPQSNEFAYIHINCWAANGNSLPSVTSVPVVATTTGWTPIIASGTTPPGSAYIGMDLTVVGTTGSSDVYYFDEMMIAPGVPGYEITVANDAPTAYWKLNETLATTTTAADFSGHAQTATLHGSIALGQPGPLVQYPSAPSYGFDGSTAYLSTSLAPPPARAFSVEAWAYFQATDTAPSNPGILSSLSGNNGVDLRATYSAGSLTGVAFYVGLGTGGTANLTASLGAGWHHIVGTYDGTSTMRLYVDGALVGTNASASGYTPGSNNWVIGQAITGSYWPGMLAQVAVYNGKALSASQVSAHYTAATALPQNAASGYVQWWTRGGLLGATALSILRSDGLQVRGASISYPAALPNPTQRVVVLDYEANPTVNYTYAGYVAASSMSVQSPYGPSSNSVVIPGTYGWWELDPTNPSSAVNAQFIALQPVTTEQVTGHVVLGQATQNVVANVMMAQDFTGTVEIFSASVRSRFNALIRSQKTIFISDPFGPAEWLPNGPYFRLSVQTASSGKQTMGARAKQTSLMPSTAGAPHVTVDIVASAQPRPTV